MRYTEEMFIDKAMLDAMDDLCEHDPGHGNGEVYYDREVTFPDGMRVAIQLIASEYDFIEEFTPPAWSQGVLFTPEGVEVSCTEVGDSLSGEYTVFDEENEYTVVVKSRQ
jgi:hypothetical protein